jgi:glycogen debranching enzyme
VIGPAPGPRGGAGDEPPLLEPDSVEILSGSTFMISDPSGDVPSGPVSGLFHADTRLLSEFALTIDGERPLRLSVGQQDYQTVAFFLTNPGRDGLPTGSLSIVRRRSIRGDEFVERIILESSVPVPVDTSLLVRIDNDFADLFEVKRQAGQLEGTIERIIGDDGRRVVLGYRLDEFTESTVVRCSQPASIQGDTLAFDVRLEPRGVWQAELAVASGTGPRRLMGTNDQTLTLEPPGARLSAEEWRARFPDVRADWDVLYHAYEQAIADLGSLRLPVRVGADTVVLPAAGMPWFMTIFGRDSLITSLQALPFSTDLARGSLIALAALQGRRRVDFTDEEPGKILHEVRFGKLTALGRTPHNPYYGTVDATPLWLVLLSEYWRSTGDDQLCRDLEDNARRALAWIDEHGDRDGDGYVEYGTRSPHGLTNQGWKDSGSGIPDASGRPAGQPIALCEVQGYCYDAKLRLAEIAEGIWGDRALATQLRADARALFERFNRDFWIEGDGSYALGLDGRKEPITSAASNMGQLLLSGIVPEDRAARLVDRLFAEDLFSGWGIRTISAEHAAYNPIGYHTGSVWPHDNSIIGAGLARYGFHDEWSRLASALLEASAHTDHRLPEVFAGLSRTETGFPVRCPTASSPQAWATGSVLLWLGLALGLRPGVKGAGKPQIPLGWGALTMESRRSSDQVVRSG